MTTLNWEDMSTKTTDDGPAHLLSNTATNGPVVELLDHEGKSNYISKCLVQFFPLKKST